MLKQDLLKLLEDADRRGLCPPYRISTPCKGDCTAHYEELYKAVDDEQRLPSLLDVIEAPPLATFNDLQEALLRHLISDATDETKCPCHALQELTNHYCRDNHCSTHWDNIKDAVRELKERNG